MTQEELAEMKKQYGPESKRFEGGWNPDILKLLSHISELESELAAAKGQVERLREALDKIGYLREHDGREDSSYLGRIAREALAKLKENK